MEKSRHIKREPLIKIIFKRKKENLKKPCELKKSIQ